MPELLYPTSKSYDGPWLIDLKSLEVLDDIVNREWDKMKQHKELRINEKIERELKALPPDKRDEKEASIEERVRNSYRFEKDKSELTINFKSGNKMAASSFEEASREPSVSSEIPIGFRLKLESGEVSTELSVNDSGYDNLKFSVEPENALISKDIFFEINKWAKSNRSPIWVRIWRSIQGLQWVLLFVMLVSHSLFVKTDYDKYKKALTAEAHKIIQNGVDSTEVNRALEILLSLETKYLPETVEDSLSISRSYVVILAIAFFICIVLSFPPKSYLGFGKGEKRVRYWKFWLKLISVTIPISILLPILLDKFKALF